MYKKNVASCEFGIENEIIRKKIDIDEDDH